MPEIGRSASFLMHCVLRTRGLIALCQERDPGGHIGDRVLSVVSDRALASGQKTDFLAALLWGRFHALSVAVPKVGFEPTSPKGPIFEIGAYTSSSHLGVL